jgi:hypothetical protein
MTPEFPEVSMKATFSSRPLAPGEVPGVDLLLRAPEILERRMQDAVTARETVRPAFEMRLPHQIDDVEMIERADHRLEESRPLLIRLARRKRGDPVE